MTNQRMRRYISLSFFILIFLSFSVYAQNDSVLSNTDIEGQTVVRKNDVTRARQEAVKDAPENAVQNESTVFLNVHGLKKYSDYLRLKEFLQSRTKIVKSIYPGRFAWQQAHFEVKISGNAQAFADELVNNGGYLLLDIKQADKNNMEINCMQKEEL